MRFASRTALFYALPATLLFLLCSGCSIYKSKGRDQFESRAGGRVKTDIGTSSEKAETESLGGSLPVDEDFSSCWIQNREEPLWSTPKGSVLQIRTLNDQKMAVCLETEQQ